MFSSFGTANNPYGGGGRVNLKRHLFGKKKSISLQSEGLDLHKVKGQHCVETWATHYNNQDQLQLGNVNKPAAAAAAAPAVVNTVSHDGQQQNVKSSSSSNEKLNRVNLIPSSPTSSTFLEKVEESKLVVKEQQELGRQQQQEPSSRLEKLNSRPLEVF